MKIVIITKDNDKISINKECIKSFKILESLLEEYNDEDEDNNEDNDDIIEIPLEINTSVLNKILEIYTYEIDSQDKSVTDQDKYNWYNNYFSISDDDMCNLLESADYLEYEYLVDLGCERIADSIRSCKSVDDVKKKFGVTKEISQDEENELLKIYK